MLKQVFYAVFDPRVGPKIISQVPHVIATALSTFPPSEAAAPPASDPAAATAAPTGLFRSTSEHGLNSTKVLFEFSSILDFVIPKPELCGHLITKATRSAKILGFPIRYARFRQDPASANTNLCGKSGNSIVNEAKYHKGMDLYNRNDFVFNVCFVFEREAELSGFEPIVRKVGRTLRDMEVRRERFCLRTWARGLTSPCALRRKPSRSSPGRRRRSRWTT